MKILTNLKEINNRNYILKLGANWCSPCKTEDTILKKDSIVDLTSKLNVDVYKVDVDDDNFEELLDTYEVSNIPVLLYFKDNQFNCKTDNLQTEQQILDNIKRIYEKV